MDEAYAISCEQPVATMFPSCFVSTVPYIRELRDRERPWTGSRFEYSTRNTSSCMAFLLQTYVVFPERFLAAESIPKDYEITQRE